MFDSQKLKEIIDEFKKSQIQSEAEVRSKLIVPLLDFLEYPSELRAEEFPVYGFSGRDQLSAKQVDFLLFSDKEFANYRSKSKKSREWVQKHSLLVVEAKKPGEMPEILGQPEFYTIWTRSVAYLIIDGIDIRGFYFSPVTPDIEVVNCSLNDLPSCKDFWNFSYKSILEMKSSKLNCVTAIHEQLSKHSEEISEETREDVFSFIEDIPENVFNYMEWDLGKNSIGLNRVEIINRYLSMTNMYLDCQLRYDIPEYMFDVPRFISEASLFVDGKIIPVSKGRITTYFWEDSEKYLFESDYIDIFALYHKGELVHFDVGYHVLDACVDMRIENLQFVQKCLNSQTLSIMFQDTEFKRLMLPCGEPNGLWDSKNENLDKLDFWLKGMRKLKDIEEFYDIRFSLTRVDGIEELNELYSNIDFVFDGIAMNSNCTISIPGGFSDEDIDILEPTLFEENTRIPLADRCIHGVVFRPTTSALLPGTIKVAGTTSKDIIKLEACCLYEVVQENNQ